jgi:hypothetical protein
VSFFSISLVAHHVTDSKLRWFSPEGELIALPEEREQQFSL